MNKIDSLYFEFLENLERERNFNLENIKTKDDLETSNFYVYLNEFVDLANTYTYQSEDILYDYGIQKGIDEYIDEFGADFDNFNVRDVAMYVLSKYIVERFVYDYIGYDPSDFVESEEINE